MIRYTFLLFIIFHSCKPVDLQSSLKGSSRASAYHDSDKMVNTQNYLFVTYLIHQEGQELVMVNRFNKANNKWDQSNILGKAKDDHGGGAMVIDSKGFLHIVYGSHNSPLFYKKSVNANDVNSWTSPLKIEGNLTYPSLVINKNDDLFLAARSDLRSSNWAIRLFIKPNGDKFWNTGSDIVVSDFLKWKKEYGKSSMSVSNGYSRFGKYMSINDENELHITFHYFEYVPKNKKTFFNNKVNSSTHFVAHTYSLDLGNTWLNNKGDFQKSPLNLKDVNIVGGNNDPSKVDCNYSAGQHFTKDDKIYFFYSKHYGIETTFHMAYSSFPYKEWDEIELQNDRFFLRAPVAVSNGSDGVFAVNAIPKSVYVNGKPPSNLPSKSRIIIGTINTQTFNIEWDELKAINSPSWLPQISNKNGDVWYMVTQGARESNATTVIINKVK